MTIKTRIQKWWKKHILRRKNVLQTAIANEFIPQGAVVYIVNGRAYGINPMTLAQRQPKK